MRMFKLMVAAFTLAGLTLGLASPVQAVNEQVVYLTDIKPGTNLACGKNLDKMFTVQLRVPKGERIRTYGAFTLTLKGGTQLSDDGYKLNRRLVEYYFYPKSRFARVKRNLARSYAYVGLSEGAVATATVSKRCLADIPS